MLADPFFDYTPRVFLLGIEEYGNTITRRQGIAPRLLPVPDETRLIQESPSSTYICQPRAWNRNLAIKGTEETSRKFFMSSPRR